MLKKKVPTIGTVAKKADAALGMFRGALAILKQSNEEAYTIRGNNHDQITSLTLDNKEISDLTNKNSKVIKNIEALLGE